MDIAFSKATLYQDDKKLCSMKCVLTVIGLKSLVFITVPIFTPTVKQ